MSGYLNIGGDEHDSSYRYKMPRLTTKVEGRGNGIKTVLPNMVEVAKALRMPPAYPTKFFGIELGAQSKFNKKDERAIVNGSHQTADMQALLSKYISIFILCPTCGLPEMTYDVKKSGIKVDCAACGHNGPLPTAHRLTTYILKNPPDKKGKKGSKSSSFRKDRKKEASVDNTATSFKKDEPEEEQEWFTDTSKDAQKKRMADEFKEMNESSGISPEVEKILEEARAQNREDAPTTVLKVYLASKEREVTDIVSELRRLQLSRGLDDPQRVKVLLESVIDCSQPKTVPAQFTKQAELMKQFAKDKTQAVTLINCLEELVGVTNPGLLVLIPHILQALYEADVLEEDAIVAWHESPPESSWLVNKDVATETRLKAQPLITWFAEAESESDEE